MAEHGQKRRIEAAALVALGRAQEFVAEAEAIEKRLQPCIVVGAETVMRAEGIGNGGERLAQMLPQHVLVGHIVGHLAQTVHVVGEGDQPRRHIREGFERLAHPARARDLAEGADMGKARRAVTGLEQDFLNHGSRRTAPADARQQPSAPPRKARRGRRSASSRLWPMGRLDLKRLESAQKLGCAWSKVNARFPRSLQVDGAAAQRERPGGEAPVERSSAAEKNERPAARQGRDPVSPRPRYDLSFPFAALCMASALLHADANIAESPCCRSSLTVAATIYGRLLKRAYSTGAARMTIRRYGHGATRSFRRSSARPGAWAHSSGSTSSSFAAEAYLRPRLSRHERDRIRGARRVSPGLSRACDSVLGFAGPCARPRGRHGSGALGAAPDLLRRRALFVRRRARARCSTRPSCCGTTMPT